MLANGAEGSRVLVGSVQKQASNQRHLPLFVLRMMCSQVSVPMGPAILSGRIASGGMFGGEVSGRGGGTSFTLSQIGICLQTPSPLHSQSHEQSARAGMAASEVTTAARCIFMRHSLL